MLRHLLSSSLVALVACSSSTTSSVSGTLEADAHVDRVRDFTSQRDGIDADVVIGSGREEWRMSVTCGSDGRGCCPMAAVTLALRFERLTAPPEVRFSLRHALHEYETSPPAVVSGAMNACFEDYVDPRMTSKPECTLVAGSGWTCDSLARRDGHPNPDESADEARPRTFVVRVENAGPPLAAHVHLAAVWQGF